MANMATLVDGVHLATLATLTLIKVGDAQVQESTRFRIGSMWQLVCIKIDLQGSNFEFVALLWMNNFVVLVALRITVPDRTLSTKSKTNTKTGVGFPLTRNKLSHLSPNVVASCSNRTTFDTVQTCTPINVVSN
jgi:hypothetical protein